MTEAKLYLSRMDTTFGENSSEMLLVTLDIPLAETREIDVFLVWWRPYAKLLRQRLREIADEPVRSLSSASMLRVILPIQRALLADTGFPLYEELEPRFSESVLAVLIRDRDRLLRERVGAV